MMNLVISFAMEDHLVDVIEDDELDSTDRCKHPELHMDGMPV